MGRRNQNKIRAKIVSNPAPGTADGVLAVNMPLVTICSGQTLRLRHLPRPGLRFFLEDYLEVLRVIQVTGSSGGSFVFDQVGY